MYRGKLEVLLTILLNGKFPQLNPGDFRPSHFLGFISCSRGPVTPRLERMEIKTSA